MWVDDRHCVPHPLGGGRTAWLNVPADVRGRPYVGDVGVAITDPVGQAVTLRRLAGGPRPPAAAGGWPGELVLRAGDRVTYGRSRRGPLAAVAADHVSVLAGRRLRPLPVGVFAALNLPCAT